MPTLRLSQATLRTTCKTAVLTMAIFLVGPLSGCSRHNPNLYYGHMVSTSAPTRTPVGQPALVAPSTAARANLNNTKLSGFHHLPKPKGLASSIAFSGAEANYPVPARSTVVVNPTVSIQPPGNQFARYTKPRYVRRGGRRLQQQIASYYTEATNGAPVLVIAQDLDSSMKLLPSILTRAGYRVGAQHRQAELASIEVQTTKSQSGYVAAGRYSLRLAPSGRAQTALSWTRRQLAMRSSKGMLRMIRHYLP